MANELIDQHKRLAMGEEVPQGECEPAFGKGRKLHKDGSEKMRHIPDHKRGMKHLERVADHGPHDMHTPKDGQSDDF